MENKHQQKSIKITKDTKNNKEHEIVQITNRQSLTFEFPLLPHISFVF
jgi:hypothetical protein